MHTKKNTRGNNSFNKQMHKEQPKRKGEGAHTMN